MGDGPDDDEDDVEDDDEEGGWEDVAQGEDGGEGGRVRSDFHSGGGPEARFRPY